MTPSSTTAATPGTASPNSHGASCRSDCANGPSVLLSESWYKTGILFVLRTGIPWEMLPAEMGCGSGVTCWRRLRDWQAAGVWDRLHRELLRRLRDADRIDWSRL